MDRLKVFLVTFPDIPEADTQGENPEDAMQAAQDAPQTALDFYFDAWRPVPVPSRSSEKPWRFAPYKAEFLWSRF
ncbi:MAG: type II toxin-antitoxin system HicB family antitoxin [Terracidiphilus sp.]